MLSLAMVIKNEVLTLERTILQMKDYVDEIIIGLDSQSDDGSEEIVRKYADKVIPIHLSDELAAQKSVDDSKEWGFAKARNKVLDACNPDAWRLTLDGHELFKDPSRIPAALAHAVSMGGDAIQVSVNMNPGNIGLSSNRFKSFRFIDPQMRYKHALHNSLKAHRVVACEDLEVLHLNIEQAQEDRDARVAQRVAVNIPQFKKEVVQNPKNVRGWRYLGAAYLEAKEFKKAAHAYTQALSYLELPRQRYMFHIWAALSEGSDGRKDYAQNHLEAAIVCWPERVEAYYYFGEIAYTDGDNLKAIEWLEQGVKCSFPKEADDQNIFMYEFQRYDLLAAAYGNTGQYEKAIEMAKRALAAVPDPRVARNIQAWQWELDHSEPEPLILREASS